MLRPGRILALALACASVAAVSGEASAKPSKKAKKAKGDPADEKAFRARLAKLTEQTPFVLVKMAVGDDPSALPKMPGMEGGFALVAGHRQIETPETLDPSDMLDVLNSNLVDIRKCYKKQLAEDPEWQDEFILDISVKKTGRVSEVSISPRRVKRDTVGQCLLSAVPRWKFPRFTGESDDGVSQEVVNGSFPIQLAPP